jgi:hypothetical protein
MVTPAWLVQAASPTRRYTSADAIRSCFIETLLRMGIRRVAYNVLGAPATPWVRLSRQSARWLGSQELRDSLLGAPPIGPAPRPPRGITLYSLRRSLVVAESRAMQWEWGGRSRQQMCVSSRCEALRPRVDPGAP